MKRGKRGEQHFEENRRKCYEIKNEKVMMKKREEERRVG